MNRVILVGRLVKDPELKYTPNDIPVVQFVLAVNRQFTNKSGERQADFINCVVWRAQAENLAKFMRKGNQIGVEGQLQVRTYEDNGGVKRYITEVICDSIHFLEPKGARNDGYSSGYGDVSQYDIPDVPKTKEQSTEDPFKDIKSTYGVSDDDLPF